VAKGAADVLVEALTGPDAQEEAPAEHGRSGGRGVGHDRRVDAWPDAIHGAGGDGGG